LKTNRISVGEIKAMMYSGEEKNDQGKTLEMLRSWRRQGIESM
jgi:hypothetical protein